ncbi:MAG TPA: sulfur oxidation c-type cytochrome SoxA [Rhodobacteraceae bacterium]|nr:sulfur oxidation c-type cytochrome SoxA [Paracoccaceae bacterium]
MKIVTTLLAASALALSAGASLADGHEKIEIDGVELILAAPAPAHVENLDKVMSGWLFRSAETQALELDDFDNPAFVFIDKGIDLFNKVEGSEGKSCASCHEDVAEFAGLRAQMPRVVDGKVQTLEDIVNDMRVNYMGAEPWKWSGGEMTSVVGLISLQSRGMPVDVKIDGDAAPFWERGKELYYTRVGQLDMACANCHEDNYGRMIRADRLSQGQINGFPTYRLKNAKLNSIHARFKGCMKNIRAKPYKEGSEEFRALELYLASRGEGLSVESPSVRN